MTPEHGRGGIFINYRQRDVDNNLRDHALFVDALSRRLSRHFGDNMVFVDTTINPGARYPDELRSKLVTCHVLLAIIHPEWVADLHQRLDRPTLDWVRHEIDIALNGSPGNDSPTAPRPLVIPVLLGDSELPAADELPGEIGHLTNLAPLRLRIGSLTSDLACLFDKLEQHIPTLWEPAPPSETKQPKYSPLGLLGGLLAVTAILQALNPELIMALFALMAFSTLGMFMIFLGIAASWAIKPMSYHAERRLQTQPAGQSMGILGLSFFGVLLMLYSALVSTTREDPAKTMVSTAIIFFGGAFVMIFMLTSSAARDRRKDREWPPWIPTGPELGRTEWLRRAVVRLDEQLASSWRPPLSRIQRDQAQHIVWQLGARVAALQEQAQRSRLVWLRVEHPITALIYAVWLIGTVAVTIFCVHILLDRQYSSVPLFLFSFATPVVVTALCFASGELWFRYQRRERIRLATELTEGLNTRLLPQLFRATPGPGTTQDHRGAAGK